MALLKLEDAAVFSERVGPVCLPWHVKKFNFTGEMMAVAGWGLTENKNRSSRPDIFHAVRVPIDYITLCKVFYSNVPIGDGGEDWSEYVTNDTICAGDVFDGGIDACQGDSGGPGTWLGSNSRAYQLGVVSFGHECGLNFYPGIYGNVTRYLEWIKDKTGVTDFCDIKEPKEID